MKARCRGTAGQGSAVGDRGHVVFDVVGLRGGAGILADGFRPYAPGIFFYPKHAGNRGKPFKRFELVVAAVIVVMAAAPRSPANGTIAP